MSPINPTKLQNRSTIGSGIRRQLKLQVLGLGIGLGFASSAFGQFNGFGNTNQGAMGQLGSIGQIGQIGGQTGIGGIGGIGQSQTGQTGLGGGLGQNSGISQLGSPNIANAFGSGGILGQNTSSAFGGLANAALLGRTLNGGAGGMGGLGGMGMGGMGGMNGMGGRGGMQGGRGGFNAMNQNQNSGNKPQIRATVKLGFEVAPVANSVSTQVVNTRLSRVPSAVLNGVNVQMNGRTAVIRGNVATLAEAKVVERYLSLEPGIDAVKNELVIASGEKLTPKSSASKKAKSTKLKAADSSDSTVKAASPEVVPAPGPQ